MHIIVLTLIVFEPIIKTSFHGCVNYLRTFQTRKDVDFVEHNVFWTCCRCKCHSYSFTKNSRWRSEYGDVGRFLSKEIHEQKYVYDQIINTSSNKHNLYCNIKVHVRSKTYGFCPSELPSFQEQTDTKALQLFDQIQRNNNHLLFNLLPPPSTSSLNYNLRTRPHSQQLRQRTGHLNDYNLFTTMHLRDV